MFGLACDEGGDGGVELDGRTFLFESAEGFEPVDGTTVTVSFETGMVSFYAGCNHHAGDFALSNARLTVTALGSTQIGCDASLHEQDTWLSSFFTSRPRIVVDGDRLTLTGEDATLVFLDREVADPDRPLVGTLWIVDTFLEGGAASSVPVAPEPTLVFETEGGLDIDTTCNTSGGRYTVSGGSIVLADIAYTEIGCDGASAQTDAFIQSVVDDGTLTFEIDAARLTLERGARGLGARAGAQGDGGDLSAP